MASEIFQMLRQFGQDVSNAVTAGPAARLRTLEFEQDVKDREAKRNEFKIEAEKTAAQEAAAKEVTDLISQGKAGTPEYWDAIRRSGASPVDIEKLRQKSTPKPKEPTHYEKEFRFAEMYADQFNQQLAQMNQSIAEKAARGEDTTADMEAFKARYDASKQILKDYVIDFEDKYQRTFAVETGRMIDQLVKNWDPKTIQNMNITMQKSIDRLGGEVSEIMDEIENNGDLLGAGVDLSGIPSEADIKKMSVGLLGKQIVDRGTLIAVLNEDDPEVLQSYIEDRDTPKEIKQLAVGLLKKLMVGQAVQRMQGYDVYKERKEERKRKKRRKKTSDIRKRIEMAESRMM